MGAPSHDGQQEWCVIQYLEHIDIAKLSAKELRRVYMRQIVEMEM